MQASLRSTKEVQPVLSGVVRMVPAEDEIPLRITREALVLMRRVIVRLRNHRAPARSSSARFMAVEATLAQPTRTILSNCITAALCRLIRPAGRFNTQQRTETVGTLGNNRWAERLARVN